MTTIGKSMNHFISLQHLPKCDCCGSYLVKCNGCGKVKDDFVFEPCECSSLHGVCTCDTGEKTNAPIIDSTGNSTYVSLRAMSVLKLLSNEIVSPGSFSTDDNPITATMKMINLDNDHSLAKLKLKSISSDIPLSTLIINDRKKKADIKNAYYEKHIDVPVPLQRLKKITMPVRNFKIQESKRNKHLPTRKSTPTPSPIVRTPPPSPPSPIVRTPPPSPPSPIVPTPPPSPKATTPPPSPKATTPPPSPKATTPSPSPIGFFSSMFGVKSDAEKLAAEQKVIDDATDVAQNSIDDADADAAQTVIDDATDVAQNSIDDADADAAQTVIDDAAQLSKDNNTKLFLDSIKNLTLDLKQLSFKKQDLTVLSNLERGKLFSITYFKDGEDTPYVPSIFSDDMDFEKSSTMMNEHGEPKFFMSKEIILTNDQMVQALETVDKHNVPQEIIDSLNTSFGPDSKLKMYGMFIYYNMDRMKVTQDELKTIVGRFGYSFNTPGLLIKSTVLLMLSSRENFGTSLYESEGKKYDSLSLDHRVVISILSSMGSEINLNYPKYAPWKNDRYDILKLTKKDSENIIKITGNKSIFDINNGGFAKMLAYASKMGDSNMFKSIKKGDYDAIFDVTNLSTLLLSIDNAYDSANIKDDRVKLLITIAFKWYHGRNEGSDLAEWEKTVISSVVSGIVSQVSVDLTAKGSGANGNWIKQDWVDAAVTLGVVITGPVKEIERLVKEKLTTPSTVTVSTTPSTPTTPSSPSTPSSPTTLVPAPVNTTPVNTTPVNTTPSTPVNTTPSTPVSVDLTAKGSGANGNWIKQDWVDAAVTLGVVITGPVKEIERLVKEKLTTPSTVTVSTTPSTPTTPSSPSTPSSPTTLVPAPGNDWLDNMSYNQLKLLAMLNPEFSEVVGEEPFKNASNRGTVEENNEMKSKIKKYSEMDKSLYKKDLIELPGPELIEVIDNVREITKQPKNWNPDPKNENDWAFTYIVNLGIYFLTNENMYSVQKSNQLKAIMKDFIVFDDKKTDSYALLEDVFNYYKST